ncbi:MAG: DegT/DnrJ/EryC1/StrS family aminotransferase [Verrucomicrobiota bacterium]|nr:DegT/DnrJ/EryC1/StrS family aminotransferase [Verrucomicrobiota bacterium]
MGGDEAGLVAEAFASNWIAPLGPHVDAFEREFADLVGVAHAAALSSGTAAIHLGLKLLGIEPGDDVLCSTFTFAATANPILYERARPIFIDSEETTWNMDPALLSEELNACAARGRLPRAVIIVDLYGQCADYDKLLGICADFSVPVIEDAAEALGASYKGRMAGSFGPMGVFSFNGNKIITTSGGGMLVSNDQGLIERARFLATQARDPAPHYQHSVIGYNYRLSNILAAIGRGQLRVLRERVSARRRNRRNYETALGGLPGIGFMPCGAEQDPNYWLTCITIDPEEFGATREEVRLCLEAAGIESRPVWKPLHLQPAFAGCGVRSRGVAEGIFERGLCLPSGSSLADEDLSRICDVVRSVHGDGTRPASAQASR